MKHLIWLVAVVLGGTGTAVAADEAPQWPTQDGDVTVVWQEPENYKDVRTGSGVQSRYQNHVFATLGKHLQKRVTPLLQDGDKVTFTVTDLDLAGDVRPSFGRTSNDIRIVKSIYPPRMAFSYQVIDGSGEAIAQGEEDLRDMGFDTRSAGRYQNESLRYEMHMLDDWIRKDLTKQLEQR
ncbi:DUF3016 domain-containing protein [Ferrimonas pelagia]|uniref:DUF3016 domain-containing protein n=1 Tax=Ferrimonas pelagia TaxID=1177826 RepID=A0ABP9EAS7_9GAMM